MENASPVPSSDDSSNSSPAPLRYPRGIPFIVLNEFCERFNNHGIRSILVLYLVWKLSFDEATATVIFHGSLTFIYFCCIIGAVIADSWWGKFKTIWVLSIVDALGSVLIAVAAIELLNLPVIELTMIGLFLMSLGTGGIKSCVAAFGGEQFQLPAQATKLAAFFSIFYFSITCGGLASTMITPVIRSDVHCFGAQDCYPLAFGLPALLIVISIVVFLAGKGTYQILAPKGNMFLRVCYCIGKLIKERFAKERTPVHEELDQSEKDLRRDTKKILNVLILYLPVPIFWTLYEQQASRWILQGTRMNGDIGFMNLKPEHMIVIETVLVLVFIPICKVLIYPILSVIGIRRPLQKMTLGGLCPAFAFMISGFLELYLQSSYPVLPESGYSQLRVFNAMPCNYSLQIPDQPQFEINSLGMFDDKYFKLNSQNESFDVEFLTKDSNCPEMLKERMTLESGRAISYFLSEFEEKLKLQRFEDNPEKSRYGTTSIRILASERNFLNRFMLRDQEEIVQYNEKLNIKDLKEIPYGLYNLLMNETVISRNLDLQMGGVYTILLMDTKLGYSSKVITITPPNSVHLLWQIPQYSLLSLAEVLFSITGLEFTFSQAPESFKSVLLGFWHLTVAIGNIVTVFIAGARFFSSQMTEYFMFAGLMFVDMGLFVFLAYRYKPVDSNE